MRTTPAISGGLVALGLLAAVMTLTSCRQEETSPEPTPAEETENTSSHVPSADVPTMADAEPRDYDGLHNVVAYHEDFYSGSVPEGEAGFEALVAMGVKTIISVDGAPPDLELAEAHGLRYIHLPIGYDGFDHERKMELARATRDAVADGPVYMHCHHGKHRSAGAAAAVVTSLGWSTPEAMVARMKVSGTSPSYRGLYACAANAVALPAAMIDAVPADFPAIQQPTGLTRSMVEIDTITEHLKHIDAAGWKPPADHPDLVPAAEAGRMADLMRLLLEDEKVLAEPEDFATLMRRNWAQAQKLEDMIVEGAEPNALSEQWALALASCKECHAKFRD